MAHIIGSIQTKVRKTPKTLSCMVFERTKTPNKPIHDVNTINENITKAAQVNELLKKETRQKTDIISESAAAKAYFNLK